MARVHGWSGFFKLTLLTMMNKSTIPVVIVVAIAVPVIGWQQSKNVQLKKELSESQANKLHFSPHSGSESSNGRGQKRRTSRGGERTPFSASDLESILADTNSVSRLKSIIAYSDGLSASDIPMVLEELRKGLGRGREFELISHILLSRWAQSDPDAAYATLADGSYRDKGWSSTSILSSLASMDPQRAADWVREHGAAGGRGRRSGRMAEVVAATWARQNPDAAFAWTLTLEAGQLDDAAAVVVSQVAATDPTKATEMAMGMEAGRARAEVVEELVESWSRTAPGKALDWALSLTGQERRQAVEETVDEWAKVDPAAAAGYLTELAGQENIEPYVSSVASRWAQQDPARAAEWVVGQAEGQGTGSAMGHVMWNWTRQDPEAAGTWLQAQPEGPNRDGAIVGLTKASSSFDPAAATQWANSISDQDRRAEMVRYSLERWQREDPKAASEWAQQHGVNQGGGNK